MALLEERTPHDRALRAGLSAADRRATLLAGLGWCLTLAAILGLPGPDRWFMGLAPAIAIVCAGAALIGIFMQRFRGGFARLLLGAGGVALAGIGIAYLRSASIVRVIVAYFIPAILLWSAAGALAAPWMRQRGNATP